MSCARNGWSGVSSADLVNNPPGRCQHAQLRKNTGLTRAQVAALRGVSQARVSQIEHRTVTEVDAIRGYLEALSGTVAHSYLNLAGYSQFRP
jgi:Sigma-70, region 4